MPTKYQFITELYQQTLRKVTGNYEAWTGFLRAASYNYKCPFDEQILIYAQRPDATAVLELERWNRQFGRWVNRGASGIVVFDDVQGRERLKYYFDVADTHAAQRSRPVPIWAMDERYEDKIIETLENTFGLLSEKETLADAIFSASHNAVADNLPDYLRDLQTCREGSFLEELDALNVEVEYRRTLESSIAYMLMSRLSIDANFYLTQEDFSHVYDFNTPDTINALGIAASDIAEMGLREIARTVLALQKEQFFANDGKVPYDTAKEESHTDAERSAQHGDDLHGEERLSDSRSADAPAGGGPSGQVRGAAAAIPDEAPAGAVHEPENELQADGTSGGDRGAGEADGGADRGADGAGRGRDGGAESPRSDALDGPDEQSEAQRGGAGAERPDLFISSEEPPEAGSDENSLPAFLDAHLMEAVVLDEGGRRVTRQEIWGYFQTHQDSAQRVDFLKNAYTDTFVEILVDGARVGYRKQDDGLLMWEGGYLSRTSESVFSWGVVTEMTENLMERGEYKIKLGLQNVPVMFQQFTLFDTGVAELPVNDQPAPSTPLFPVREVPEDVIEKVLYTAGNEFGSAYRVAAFYMRERPEEENVAFLRREFGAENGRGIEHEGRKYAVWFTEDGIRLAQGDNVRTGYSRTTVSWEQVSARILELLNDGVYLSPAELERARDHALRDMADALLMTARELTEEARATGLFTQTLAIHDQPKGYPDLEKEVAAFASSAGGLETLALEYHDFLAAYAKDRTITRFRVSEYNTHRIGVMLDGLSYPERHFTAQPDFLRQCKMFITQDEIDCFFLSGGAESSLSVYSHFCYPHTTEEHQKFIKGFYGEYSGGACDGYDHTKTRKGLTYKRDYGRKTYDEVTLTIPKVVKQYERLIAQKRFPGEDALAKIPEYEANQLARSVYHGFYDAPKEIPKPYLDGSDYYKAVPAIEAQLSDPAKVREMLENLTAALDATDESDRYFDLRKTAKEQLAAYLDGTFSLFNHRHDGLRLQPEVERDFVRQVEADAAAIAANEPERYERFSVIDIGGDYAVWDDLKNEIYVDGNDNSEYFSKEWQAEAYLEQLKKSVADKETAEWERIEQAEPPLDIRASYHSDDERIVIARYPSGQYYNLYGYDEHTGAAASTAGGFPTFEEAEKALYAHRPTAEAEQHEHKRQEPVKAASPEQPEETTDRPLAPPAPRKKDRAPAFAPLDPHGVDYVITDDALGAGTPSERYANNVTAIRLLHELDAEGRTAVSIEKAALARYVGWGGLSDCFDPKDSRYGELKALLDEGEYASARESTLTAFYTPPIVARSIYQVLERMGFSHGNVLEPSCGTGNFMGLLPESMRGSKLYGVELDSISGRIARQLYPTAGIAVQGYEKTNFPDNFFDVAIGNVPFGAFKLPDRRYDKQNLFIHDYFFAKTIDKIRAGGVIAFITSNGMSGGTLDKRDRHVREYIARRCDLLGAIRLPNNAFVKNAGTDMTTDIVFLQKLDAPRPLDVQTPEWVSTDTLLEQEHTNEKGETRKRFVTVNRYFQQHPEMVLGEQKIISGPFGPQLVCEPNPEQDLSVLLSDAIQNIQGNITEYERGDELDGEDKSIEADPTVRNFSYTVVDGKLYYRENSRMNPVEVSKTAESRIRGLIGLRDCVRTLLEYQTEDYPDADIKAQQAELNARYDRFTKEYGLINSRGNSLAFSEDSAYFLLCSLELVNEDGALIRKADLFTKRTIRSHRPAEKVDTAVEALAVSIGEKARIDMDYMGQLTGKSEEQLFADLTGVVFLNPNHAENVNEKYLPADEYLSGNVRQKLAFIREKAQNEPQYAANVTALEQVQPVDLTAAEISVRLGATWLNPDYYRQFIFETLGTPRSAQWNIKVHYSKITGEWRVEGKSQDRGNVKAFNTYGTKRVNAYEIIEDSLNLKDVRIFDYVYEADGRKTAVLNKKETAIAQSKQELLKEQFTEWIWKAPERREVLCKAYNILFNSNRPREYDGSHITFSGMNPEITLREHQVNAIAHIMYGGNTLLAHVVGAGKTFEMVAAAMESKRLGLCQKSLFVVPNHLTEQWATEFLQLYPAASVLVATKKDFETKNRKKFCGRIATGEYDAVIIGHSQFEKIPMSVERQRAILEQQRDEILMGISEAKRDRAENFTVKQMEKTRKGIEAKIDKLNDQSRKDDVVTFEELGCDRLFIDESHFFKNLFLYTKMRNVGGIAQTEAQKSSDLFMKCRYLDELTGGRGIVFATGTPISNSMVELYTIQRYLQMNALQEQGLQHFDSWAANYGETVTAIELSPEGTGYRAKTRFAKFYNLPELMSMFKNVADIQTADMLNLPVPEGHYHNVALKPSEYQKEMVAGLAKRAERVRNREVDSSVDNMLLITNDGRKLALDQRLISPMLPADPGSKAAKCAETVFEIWQRTAAQRSTQMIFCDLSTPSKPIDMELVDGTAQMTPFQNVYWDIEQKLLAMGVPKEEIAFIHNAKSDAQKKDLFAKVRAGQVRILLGSTFKMGAGTNVQQKLVALHHLDCPWRPSDLQQREGRIIRQGNGNDEVDIYSYVTEGTFDAYLYQLVESKQKFIAQIMTSRSPVRSAEDVDETALSYAEIKALASGNPEIKEKMDLDIAVSKLKLLKSSHLSQRYALEDAIVKTFPKEIVEQQARLSGYGADIATVRESTHPSVDGFSPMTLAGTTYAEKKEAGGALLALCQNMLSPEATQVGEYRGLTLELSFDSFAQEYRMTMTGQLRHMVTLGTDVFGNLQRMDNALETLPVKEQTCRERLGDLQTQMETAKTEVDRPFAREDELRQKTARLEELNALLNMDNKAPTEPEQAEKTKEQEYER